MKLIIAITTVSLGCAGGIIAMNREAMKSPVAERVSLAADAFFLKDQKILNLSSQLAKMKVEKSVVEPLQRANEQSNLHTYSRVLTLPKKYFIKQIDADQKEIKFTLYEALNFVNYNKNIDVEKQKLENANIEEIKATKISELKYNLDDGQIYALEGSQWKTLKEHDYFKRSLHPLFIKFNPKSFDWPPVKEEKELNIYTDVINTTMSKMNKSEPTPVYVEIQ